MAVSEKAGRASLVCICERKEGFLEEEEEQRKQAGCLETEEAAPGLGESKEGRETQEDFHLAKGECWELDTGSGSSLR